MNSNKLLRLKIGIAAMVLAVFVSGTMCACTDANGAIPNDREVFRKVESVCPNEEYELVSKVDISDGTPPACVEYTFITKERGLKFTARSTLRKNWGISHSAWYSKTVICSYDETVKELYLNDVCSELRKCPLYYPERKSFYISSFAQIETVAESLAAAQAIYRQELQYNSAEFLQENKLLTVYLCGMKASAAECLSDSDIMSHVCSDYSNLKDIVYISDMEVAICEYDEIYDKFAMNVTEDYMEGRIYLEDEIPQEYINRWHQQQTDLQDEKSC